jgi:hypothetical protein
MIMENSKWRMAWSGTWDWTKTVARFGSMPGGQPIDQQFPHIFSDAAGVGVVGGQGMPIRHEEEALILLL